MAIEKILENTQKPWFMIVGLDYTKPSATKKEENVLPKNEDLNVSYKSNKKDTMMPSKTDSMLSESSE